MRKLLAVLFLLTVSSFAFAVDPKADPLTPWRVFSDTAPVVAAPDREAQPVSVLAKDDLVSGTLSVDKETNDEWLAFKRGDQQLFVSRIYLTRPHPANIRKGDLAYGTEYINRWWGIPLDYVPSDLVKVPEKYSEGKDEYELRKEACDQLVKMFDAAAKEGVHIRVASAYRSGELQVRIYSRSTRRDAAQRSSAAPGHSEHQLGSTVDLGDDEGKHSIRPSFEGTPQSVWLEKHAVEYGYARTYYPDNIDETGYISEPWHWRYFGRELATKKVAERKAKLDKAAKEKQ